jgi:uncharacterized lipoprotein
VKRHFSVRPSIPALIVAATLLGGCGWFHRSDRTDYYKGTQETRPLEVPPDLDSPTTNKELIVPGATSAAGAAGGAAVGATPPAGDVSGSAVDLHIADTADNTYQRVGLALDHVQLGKVSSKDDAAHSYAYDFDGDVTTQPAAPQEHHWYSRVLHPFGGGDKAQTQHVKAAVRVNVIQDGNGARVSVVGAPGDKSAEAAAQRLTAALRERLS